MAKATSKALMLVSIRVVETERKTLPRTLLALGTLLLG